MKRPLRALCAALPLLVLAPPAQASDAVCGPGPVELATGGPVSALDAPRIAGQDAVVGYLLRRREGAGRDCVVPGGTVQLLAREKNSTIVRVVRTGTTDAEGRVQFRIRPPRTVVLRARYAAPGDAAPVESASAYVGVRTRLTLTERVLPGCRLELAGRTVPAKPGTRVDLQARERQLRPVTVAADGTYRTVQAVPCAGRAAVGRVAETHSNETGYSDLPEAAATRTTTCGTGGTDQGPLAPGLTHRLVVFDTDTAVGGTWFAERVVANPTDSPVSYTYGRGFSVGEPYRVMRPGTQQVVGREQRTDGGEPATTRTLQPGEEVRTPVRLFAANCSRDQGPVFETAPGAPLPPGRYVGTSELRVDGDRTWTSQRVALTVG